MAASAAVLPTPLFVGFEQTLLFAILLVLLVIHYSQQYSVSANLRRAIQYAAVNYIMLFLRVELHKAVAMVSVDIFNTYFYFTAL